MQINMKNALITIGIVGTLVIAGDVLLPISKTELPVYTADNKTYEVLDSRILDNNKDIQFVYKDTEVVGKFSKDEILEKRTANSFTEKITNESEYKATIYSGYQFFKEDGTGKWFKVGYATTSKDQFINNIESPPSAYFTKRVYADTFISLSGDGFVTNFANPSTWAAAHDASVGSDADKTSVYFEVGNVVSGTLIIIERAFIPFDTSAIPGGSTVSSSSLTMTQLGTGGDADNDGDDFFTVLQTTQPSTSALTTSDYNDVGATSSPTEGSDRLDLSTNAASKVWFFTLNSTGRGWIATNGTPSTCGGGTGITCLGMREGHDIVNSSIANGAFNYVDFSSSETALLANKPTLTVIYSAGGGSTPANPARIINFE